MKGVLVLPGTGSAQFAANLIDRPFLRHTVDSMANRGLRDIRIVGPASAVSQARDLLRLGYQWDASMGYCEADSPAQYELLAIAGNTEQCLIASASCLPGLRPAVDPETHSGSIIYGTSGEWTGWALINAEDIASLPRLCHEPEVLSHLQSLPNYAGIAADAEFRCCTAEQIWQAHHDAQESNFSGLSHAGIETKPGVWIARNASVAGSAEITPPVYIGENSRIGPETKIGPFAVIAKDCLIAARTTVRHAVVAPGTYAGDNLELDHVLVDKSRLFDLRFGVSIDGVDGPMLDGVFDFHWPAITERVQAAVASCAAGLSSRLSRIRRDPETDTRV